MSGMGSTQYFVLQWVWFLVAWTVIATFFVAPRARRLDVHDALSIWVAPHLFRVLGVGLLVPNLSPGLPASFAVSTAIGDSLTSILALLSLVALRRRWRRARSVVWVFNLFGSVDLAVAMVQAARIQAASYLEAQWYVPALGVPLMVVCHVMVFHTLLRRGRESAAYQDEMRRPAS